MDNEKSMTEKLTDALSKATDSVKSTIGNMVDTASGAAQRAMESNAERISGQSSAELAPEQIATTANEQVYLPPVTDAVAAPVPLVAARKPRTKSRAGETPPAKKALAKKSGKKAARKTANKPATKSAPKKSRKNSAKKAKKSAGKTGAKKATMKSAKTGKNKTSKRSKR